MCSVAVWLYEVMLLLCWHRDQPKSGPLHGLPLSHVFPHMRVCAVWHRGLCTWVWVQHSNGRSGALLALWGQWEDSQTAQNSPSQMSPLCLSFSNVVVCCAGTWNASEHRYVYSIGLSRALLALCWQWENLRTVQTCPLHVLPMSCCVSQAWACAVQAPGMYQTMAMCTA